MKRLNKISVVINTYNAEEFLARVLDSVKDFDEILVCDMESTDNTVEIARQYGCKVVTFPKKDYVCAEPARTFAIKSSQGPWVLVVDADELVTPELHDYLYRRIESDDCPDGLWIPRRDRIMNKLRREKGRDYQLRFFLRDVTVWPPYVHTFPEVNGRLEYISNKEKNVELIHLDENRLRSRLDKINRYTEGELEKKKDKRWGLGALFYRPFWRFFRSYVLMREFRYGKAGFIKCLYDGLYQFVLVSKIIERRMRKEDINDQSHDN
ncbi:MAG: glycosyltransferase family 2 protein [Prevotella sp.]|jgi:glycosyltransferase involved in cell wall biosynthesis